MHTTFAFFSWFSKLDLQAWKSDNRLICILLLAFVVLALVGVGYLYVKEAGRLGIFPRAIMAGVRMAIIVTVAILLLRPVWTTETQTERVRPVAVLIDVSQSMESKDPRPNTADQWRAAMAFGLVDADKGFPQDTLLTSLSEKIPERPKRIEVARAVLTNSKYDLFKRLVSRAGSLDVYTFGARKTQRDWVANDWLKDLGSLKITRDSLVGMGAEQVPNEVLTKLKDSLENKAFDSQEDLVRALNGVLTETEVRQFKDVILKYASGTESRTALVEAAFELLNRDDGDAPAAMVLVTDGRENASNRSLGDLAGECTRRKIPVFVYGVGSSAFSQLRVKEAIVPETLFVDDRVSVPIRYLVRGVKQGKVEIVLTHNGQVVDRKEYAVKQGDDLREVLSFVPTKEDATARKKQEVTATVTVTTGNGGVVETLTDSITRPTRVVDKKLKVLVVDSLPRYDFKYLQRALLRDRRVDAKFYLTEGDKLAMRSGPPWMIDFTRELNGTLNIDRSEFRKILFEFDLLILGDVPGKYFTDEHKDTIVEFVKEGGGLIQIAGRWHAPHDWATDKIRVDEDNKRIAEENKGKDEKDRKKLKIPLADILPVAVQPVQFPIQALNNPVPFVPVLTAASAHVPITTLEDDPIENAELWGKPGIPTGTPSEKQLKPMYWYYPVVKIKPAADVFLTHPTARTPAPDNRPMPLLAGHYYGEGYVLFVGFDDTWRWRFNSAEKLFGRFWSQAVYVAGVPRTVGTKLTQLSLDATDPTYGKTGQLFARVYDENFKLLTDEEIDATLEKTDAEPNDKDRLVPVKLKKLPGQDGDYVAPIPFNRTGRFKLTVDPKNKTPASLEYRVSLPLNHELAPGGLDEEAMRKLCDATGGKFYREEDVYQLPADVKPQSVTFSFRDEVVLWNRWALFLLIGLLSLEWCIRKFNGLS